MNILLQDPNLNLVNEYIRKFDDDKKDSSQEQSIQKLILTFPKNIDLKDVILKVAVINSLYGTNIYDVFSMASHICYLANKEDLDGRLQDGDISVVSEIATGHGIGNNIGKNFYSFATKYCHFHNEKDYPIYDSFVDKILTQYIRKDKFIDSSKPNLRNYPEFKNVISEFQKRYGLEGVSLSDIDKFLWKYSKELSSDIVKDKVL